MDHQGRPLTRPHIRKRLAYNPGIISWFINKIKCNLVQLVSALKQTFWYVYMVIMATAYSYQVSIVK
jgi:hypothetical protein